MRTAHNEKIERLSRALAYMLAGTATEKQQACNELGALGLTADEIEPAMAAYGAAIDARLTEDVAEYVSERRSILAESNEAKQRSHPILIRMSEVQPEPVQWLWPNRIARGKLSMLVGDPGVGKSTLTTDVTARVSCGTEWPDGGARPPANVILLSAEDGLADTTSPRLIGAGADLKRVTVLRRIRRAGVDYAVTLSDLSEIEMAMEIERPALVIIDPISAYMGPVDTHREAAVRQVLSPLAELAERQGVAVLGLLHLNKSEATKIANRVSGSIAYVAAARIVEAVVPESDEDGSRRVYGRIKGNIGRRPPDLAYTLVEASADVARVQWCADGPTKSIKSILQSFSTTEDERSERVDATDYLREVLGGGRSPSQEVIRGAREVGISERTLNRGKADLRIVSDRVDGRWYWRLPAEESI